MRRGATGPARQANTGKLTDIDEAVELRRLRRMEARVEAFKQASGVDVAKDWTGRRIGEAVDFVLRGGLEEQRRALQDLSDRAREIITTCETALTQSES